MDEKEKFPESKNVEESALASEDVESAEESELAESGKSAEDIESIEPAPPSGFDKIAASNEVEPSANPEVSAKPVRPPILKKNKKPLIIGAFMAVIAVVIIVVLAMSGAFVSSLVPTLAPARQSGTYPNVPETLEAYAKIADRDNEQFYEKLNVSNPYCEAADLSSMDSTVTFEPFGPCEGFSSRVTSSGGESWTFVGGSAISLVEDDGWFSNGDAYTSVGTPLSIAQSLDEWQAYTMVGQDALLALLDTYGISADDTSQVSYAMGYTSWVESLEDCISTYTDRNPLYEEVLVGEFKLASGKTAYFEAHHSCGGFLTYIQGEYGFFPTQICATDYGSSYSLLFTLTQEHDNAQAALPELLDHVMS